ncbi:MAG: hemin receptor [Chlorobi bacterium]|nr:hemin receptor [Chlorobiota bacterium]
MTSEQITLVRSTFGMVAPIAEQAAELFYNRLFVLDPALRPLFTGDMKEQGRKLMAMLAMVVNGLDRFESLTPAVRDLGRRHDGYAVKPEDYDTVGAALLWTLEQGLGEAFTPDVKDAWAIAYGIVATTMIAGGRSAVHAAPAAAETA